MVFYSLALDMETHALLCNTLHNLLNMTYKTFLNELRQQVSVKEKTNDCFTSNAFQVCFTSLFFHLHVEWDF